MASVIFIIEAPSRCNLVKENELKENEQKQTAERLIRINDVLARVPISRSSWYAGIKDGRFPLPVKLGVRISAWRERDIRELLDRGTA